MRNDECERFEESLAYEVELDECLVRHATECLGCRALAQVSALSAHPVVPDEDDPLIAAVRAAASSIARRRADRCARRRRFVPFVIGLAGYLIAGVTAVLGLLLDGRAAPAVPQPGDSSLPALPPPQPAALAAVFAAAAVWIAAVAFLTRSRRSVLEPNTHSPEL